MTLGIRVSFLCRPEEDLPSLPVKTGELMEVKEATKAGRAI
ncbi:hypothetical protein [Agriterribacter sp.]|nr:hypothetical protein [Agriterribacter sp.]HTN05539.1 hypothetical protein [Agriterribacter sp.]